MTPRVTFERGKTIRLSLIVVDAADRIEEPLGRGTKALGNRNVTDAI